MLKIGSVSRAVATAAAPHLVPRGHLPKDTARLPLSHLQHLQWLMRKDNMGQDVFLLGLPGSFRRHLVLQYCELSQREVEYVALSRDTTEADLKQRRELQNGSAVFSDQASVRAAVNGRVLLLEGFEKAERNLLPVLNNLIENREMALEDGRFLVAPARYDKLARTHTHQELAALNLVRVHPDFRVFALGLPVPPLPGNTLDPPLRSRLQARRVVLDSFEDLQLHLQDAAPALAKAEPDMIKALASFGATLHSLSQPGSEALASMAGRLQPPSADALEFAARFLQARPDAEPAAAIELAYPHRHFMSEEHQAVIEKTMQRFDLVSTSRSMGRSPTSRGAQHTVPPTPSSPVADNHHFLSGIPAQAAVLNDMAAAIRQRDVCLVGKAGEGKSAVMRQLAKQLATTLHIFPLFKDMTARDLLQQRYTLANGDTAWRPSVLLEAALNSGMVVLDGLHTLHPSTLTVLQRLAQDRELDLSDGRRLVARPTFEAMMQELGVSAEQLRARGVLPVHPDFSLAAIAELPASGSLAKAKWFTEELQSMFSFHVLPQLDSAAEEAIIAHRVPALIPTQRQQLMDAVRRLREASSAGILGSAVRMSLRRVLQIAERLSRFPDHTSLRQELDRVCLVDFMPSMARTAVTDVLNDVLGPNKAPPGLGAEEALRAVRRKDQTGREELQIGSISFQVAAAAAVAKIPQTLFYDNTTHLKVMQEIMKDFHLNRHTLLIGNQGVGKNKIVDHLLMRLALPREYMQLHRDTTVQSLSQQPTLINGRLAYEDSPLIRAAKEGSVMVVDETDKAPTHVVSVLKSLVESGHMLLPDGRQLVPHDFPAQFLPEEKLLRSHPDFRMIFLANRPGFPFLGNDFFAAMGDLFSCHAVHNPSPEAEKAMLQEYAPRVPADILGQLCEAFAELRQKNIDGLLNYPYSLRELVSIARHLNDNPDEDIAAAVSNVFDYESFSHERFRDLHQVLRKHGLPLYSTGQVRLADRQPLPAPIEVARWTVKSNAQTPLSAPLLSAVSSLFASQATVLPHVEQASIFVNPRWHSFAEESFALRLPEFQGYIPQPAAVAALAQDKTATTLVALNQPYALLTIPADRHSQRLFDLRSLGRRPFGAGKPQLQPILLPNGHSGALVLNGLRPDSLLIFDSVQGSCHEVSLKPSSALQKTLAAASSFLSGNSSSVSRSGSDQHLWRPAANQRADDEILVLQTHGRVVFVHRDQLSFYELVGNVLAPDGRMTSGGKSGAQLWSALGQGRFLVSAVTEAASASHNSIPDSPLVALVSVTLENGSKALQIRTQPLEFTAPRSSSPLPTSQIIPALPLQAVGRNQKLPHAEEGPTQFFVDRLGACYDIQADNWQDNGGTLRRVASNLPVANTTSKAAAPPLHTWVAPFYLVSSSSAISSPVRETAATLRVLDVVSRTARHIDVPLHGPQQRHQADQTVVPYGVDPSVIDVAAVPGQAQLVTLDGQGILRWFDVGNASKALDSWTAALGQPGGYAKIGGTGKDGRSALRLQLERSARPGLEAQGPKHGKVDPDNTPHVGGNTWAGGTGGRDTAGLGGKGGPYRLDAGHQVHQLSDEEKARVPPHIREAAVALGREAYAARLREINMSNHDAEVYGRFLASVSTQVQAIRAMLEQLKSPQEQRLWLKNQTQGDLDDSKLVDGATGDQVIYKRFGQPDWRDTVEGARLPDGANPQEQERPKRLRVVMDVSGSMYRFNSVDQRLQRSLEAACMLMEGLSGPAAERRLRWDMVGHSGEEVVIPLTGLPPPADEAQRLKVLQNMMAHAQFCLSGDNTVEATRAAVQALAADEDADERIVVVVSDANLDRYAIPAESITAALQAGGQDVHAFLILIGSLGDQAVKLHREMPAGTCYLCMRTEDLPNVLQQIFQSTIVGKA